MRVYYALMQGVRRENSRSYLTEEQRSIEAKEAALTG